MGGDNDEAARAVDDEEEKDKARVRSAHYDWGLGLLQASTLVSSGVLRLAY